MLQSFFYLSCALAVVAFVLFFGLGLERFLVLRAVNKRLKQHELAQTQAKDMRAELQAGPLEGADKIIEALAKLTDSLSKAPFHVVALIGSVLFLLIALGAVIVYCRGCKTQAPPEKTKETVTTTEAERCTVGAFAEGSHEFQSVFKDSPAGCFEAIAKRLREKMPAMLLIVGHCDLRELNPGPRHIYASNLSLGYQRAMIVRTKLLGSVEAPPDHLRIDQRTLLLSAGASNIRGKAAVGSMQLAEDRVVEVMPLWSVVR